MSDSDVLIILIQIVDHEKNQDKQVRGRHSEYAFTFDQLFEMAKEEREENEKSLNTTETESVTDSTSVMSNQ